MSFTTSYEREIAAAHKNGPPDGKCFNMHGHTWRIKVDIRQPSDAVDITTGWGIDFHILKDIIDFYDHTTLNLFTYEAGWLHEWSGLFTNEMIVKRAECDPVKILTWPSAEGVAMAIWTQVKNAARMAEDIVVTVYEGSHECVKFDGND